MFYKWKLLEEMNKRRNSTQSMKTPPEEITNFELHGKI